jgi:hypothetical protein
MKRIALLALATVLLLLFASCATIQRSRDQGSVAQVAQMINEKHADRLIGMSVTPFLLDQEIVLLDRDVATFWKTVVEAGFRVEEPVLERGERIDESSYRQFFDSMEVRSFFKRYLERGTRLLELRTSEGQRILLLVTDSWFSRKIHGFKGPF